MQVSPLPRRPVPRPTLRFASGKWNRMIINRNDRYTSLPVDLASPSATYRDAAAKIYTFKLMTGNQPADKVNKTVLVPHLFGTAGGPNAFWTKFDWGLALQDGAAYTGQTYSGQYEFVNTTMLLRVDHEVAPKEMAYGKDNDCTDCHFQGQIDWPALGWPSDPVSGQVIRP